MRGVRAHGSATGPLCLMCAEREPLDCHRCLLVARALAERGFSIGHILHDGTIEPHAATEQRLLDLDSGGTGRPLRNWTGRATRGSVSAPRPCRCVPGEGKSQWGEVGRTRAAMRRPCSPVCCQALPAFLPRSRRASAPAPAQDTDTLDPTPPGTLNPQPLPPLANPDSPSTPAKELFGRKPEAVSRSAALRSAPMPTAASPAPCRCRSPARPGK